MTTAVVALCPRELVREDTRAIRDLYDRLGPVSAERVLARAVDELALSISTLATQVRRHDMRDLQWQSRRLQKQALGLGLISLAGVAGDLRRCDGDPTAFAAVCARLMRVAGGSLDELSCQVTAGA
ncbi:hypothetical protein [Paragemmobacter straminiformis]|uniref:Uncharacterized protein n=1 Tax=Paragemmobacter straminiformis TaxID=2045119 RepID=A0A842I9F6_9RHOB|nr:hypothetical protein [Gemmobacter straminiformis]MBC2836246.1 hypothetical protein [Gemmobacter straminiformis]